MRAQRAYHILSTEPMRIAIGEDARRERAKPARVFRRRSRFAPARPYERPDAPPGLEDACALELGVHARDGVGVHFELHGQLADRRELIARLQPPRRNG